jgi:DNA invertase Pin-like site-specific DNA recombinase
MARGSLYRTYRAACNLAQMGEGFLTKGEQMIRAAIKLAVAYYRMSTDRQEASIPAQREAVEKYAAENGYQIIREYIDEGISGDATEKRIQFKRMIADAEQGKFEAILCWDMDRFGRFDSIEAGRWVYPLRANHVHLATVAQGEMDWTDFAGRMMYGIQTEAKHSYLTDLSRNVTRGMMRLAQQGQWPGGKPPIGYMLKDKRLEPGPTEAVALVRRMFREYMRGKSLRGLAETLNLEGQLSPKGKQWTANGIAGVLKNRAYIGDFIWNQRCDSKYKRKGRTAKFNQAAEWIVIEHHHPAIIDRPTFATVQEQLTARRTCSTPHPSGGGFVLSGVLFCGKCGHKMSGDLGNGVHQYTCYGYRQHGKGYCDSNRLRQQIVLDAILTAVEREYFNPQTMERLATECRRQLKAKGTKPEAIKLRKELAEVEAKLAKAQRRLVEVDADLIDDVQQQTRKLKARRASLAGILKAAGKAPVKQGDEIDAKAAAALAWFGRLKEAARRADPMLLRKFIREAFEKVEIWTEKERWTDRRFKRKLKRGRIHLRTCNLLSTPRRFCSCSARFAAPCSGIRGGDRSGSRRGRDSARR